MVEADRSEFPVLSWITVRHPRLARVGGIAFGLVVLLALARVVVRDWSGLGDVWGRLDPGYLVLSVLAYLLAEAGFGLASALGLRRVVGDRVGLARGAAGFLVAETAKHVPGGLWPAVARAGLASRWGMEGRATVRWLMVETVASVSAGLAVGAGALAVGEAMGYRTSVPAPAWGLCAVAALGLPVVVHRRSPVARLARRWTGELPPPVQLVPPLLACLGVWAVKALASAALVRSLVPLGMADLLALGGAACLAWIGGFLVPFVPAGLGVREAIFVFLARGALPASLALSVMLAARVLTTVVQTGLATAAVPMVRTKTAVPETAP
jgi:glycosyltransferase 2 family protein